MKLERSQRNNIDNRIIREHAHLESLVCKKEALTQQLEDMFLRKGGNETCVSAMEEICSLAKMNKLIEADVSLQ